MADMVQFCKGLGGPRAMPKKTINLHMLALLGLILIACETSGVSLNMGLNSGFKGKYLSARNALENGSYPKAVRSYQSLLKSSGPLEARVRLEYAHSLLRADRFSEAFEQAKILADSQTGVARSTALSVQATAEHELALTALANGMRDGTVKDRLKSAKSALDEMLKNHKELDTLGAMAARRSAIKKALSTL